MTAIVWDQVGERRFESGVDRAVLYIPGQDGVPWNGIRSIDESSNVENKAYYLEGRKYLENAIPGDFSGKLTAFTYPDEFEVCMGRANFAPPFTPWSALVHDQRPRRFSLSYRTGLGNDQAQESGYRIHILYNLLATPNNIVFESAGDQPNVNDFSWNLSGVPNEVGISPLGYRMSSHISVDSNRFPEDALQLLEQKLYGTSTTDPELPTISEVMEIVGLYDGTVPKLVFAPVIDAQPNPIVGDILHVSLGVWSNAPFTSWTFQWYANGVQIPDAYSDTYTVAIDYVGMNLSCSVLMSNSYGDSVEEFSAPTGEVLEFAP